MHETIQATLMTLIHAAIVAVVPILTTMLVAYLKRKAAHVAATTQNETVRHALAELTEVSSAVVAKFNQAVVDTHKASGTFTPLTQANVLEDATDAVAGALCPATMDFLRKTYGDVSGLIEAKVEEAVRAQKGAKV